MIEFWLLPLKLTLSFWSAFGFTDDSRFIVQQAEHFSLLAADGRKRLFAMLTIPGTVG